MGKLKIIVESEIKKRTYLLPNDQFFDLFEKIIFDTIIELESKNKIKLQNVKKIKG